jgi:hypothetical protein
MRRVAALLIVPLALSLAPDTAAAQDNDADDKAAADLVAVQVRDQGYACDDPTSATREQDQDGDAVWRLDCQNASYRVRLVPDMAAAIEKID